MLSRACASELPTDFVGKAGTLSKGTGSVWAWPCRLHPQEHLAAPSPPESLGSGLLSASSDPCRSPDLCMCCVCFLELTPGTPLYPLFQLTPTPPSYVRRKHSSSESLSIPGTLDLSTAGNIVFPLYSLTHSHG